MYEDFKSKFKLYPRVNTVVAIQNNCIIDKEIMGKSNQSKTF